MSSSAVLRVKRKKRTIFVTCDIEAGDKPAAVKSVLEHATAVPVDRLRLWVEQTKKPKAGEQTEPVVTKSILDDTQTLASQGVKADHVLFMVFRQDNGAWEEVSVDPFED